MKSRTIIATLVISFLAFASARASERPLQTRALWAGPEAFATAKATDVLIERCQRAALNLILADVMVYQTISFKSDHFHGRIAASDSFDPLAYLSQRCRAAGIKLQAWCCVYYEGIRDPSKGPLHPEWAVRSLLGQPFDKNFISPAHPQVNAYLLSVLNDLLAYDIDGIHLDYIRYPGSAFDYSDAARRACKRELGFDPQDLLDHPERIVPPELETFPVRVLCPTSHVAKVWETTAIERTLDQAGLGHAFVSESPENIRPLRAPGLLILSSYYEVPDSMARALEDFVRRGGSLLWTDLPGKALANSVALQQLTGVASSRWLGERKVTLHPVGQHPLAAQLHAKSFRTDAASQPVLRGAQILATNSDGTPMVLLNEVGTGRVITLAFHLMRSTSPEVAALARRLTTWCATAAGRTATNPLAAKRAAWVAWRGERVTQLVRDLSAAAKAKHPARVVSSSAGPSPFEFYASYRDAARWLAEGINDEVFPMNYTAQPEVLAELLELQSASAPAGTHGRIYPGLQLYAPRPLPGRKEMGPADAAIIERQLRIVRELGYRGFCLFAYNYLTDEIIDVVRRYGE